MAQRVLTLQNMNWRAINDRMTYLVDAREELSESIKENYTPEAAAALQEIIDEQNAINALIIEVGKKPHGIWLH